MPVTYDVIASYTLGGSGTITFSSIPATYTDLILVTKMVSTGLSLDIRLNGDSGSNYSWVTLWATTGSTVDTTRTNNFNVARLDDYGYPAGSVFTHLNIAHIMDYKDTAIQKTILSRANNIQNGLALNANLWRNTAAINSIAIQGTYLTGSMATLYGVLAA